MLTSPGGQSGLSSALNSDNRYWGKADVLFLRNIRGQVTVLRLVDRGRNNSEILPEDTAEM
jgi:hypothetical protein